MLKSIRQDKFLQLREKFPRFCYEGFDFTLDDEGLRAEWHFTNGSEISFHPRLFFPRKNYFQPDKEISKFLPTLLFNIGMIELISYWKATCSPVIVIRPGLLSPGQVTWWKRTWFNGLGEFFYLNGIETDLSAFTEVECAGSRVFEPVMNHPSDSVIIPVGGGKDSIVTLELLGGLPGSIPLILNPRGASLNTVLARGYSEDGYIDIRRTIDPALLKLNDEGYLNGHTPFSALLGFVCTLAAVISGRRYVTLSNESSANEATIPGTTINHQYSKTAAYEKDFRHYLREYLAPEVEYFSFLRPLNELQIARLFTGFPKYFQVFRSCNAGSKTDSWCGKCSKCLFSYIILSPFLPKEVLKGIFGRDLFDDPDLIHYFDQLTGIADEKPFECVGTVSEVNAALEAVIQREEISRLPLLLQHYTGKKSGGNIPMASLMKAYNPDHHLEPRFEKILKQALNG
jgi:UDP-N-acetyl-alpha-D-muramoyl-L-alanyl-L-glutamate epimerase